MYDGNGRRKARPVSGVTRRSSANRTVFNRDDLTSVSEVHVSKNVPYRPQKYHLESTSLHNFGSAHCSGKEIGEDDLFDSMHPMPSHISSSLPVKAHGTISPPPQSQIHAPDTGDGDKPDKQVKHTRRASTPVHHTLTNKLSI